VSAGVTVLMPVRDTPRAMLAQAIDSILAQSFRDFEFLILDDGSREQGTRQCLEQRAAQDCRIRLECCIFKPGARVEGDVVRATL
jgi:glycosyltransferase involved in cell wall biosynthesis